MAAFNSSHASRQRSGQRERRAKFHFSVQTQLGPQSAVLETYLTRKGAHLHNAWLRFFKGCAPVEYLLLPVLLLFLFISCVSSQLLSKTEPQA